jgi:hypothetical protein
LSLRANEILGLVLAQLVGFLLEQKCGELHRFGAYAPVPPDRGRNLFEALEGSRCERDETPLGPSRIRRPAPPAGTRKRASMSASSCKAPKYPPEAVNFPRRPAPRSLAILSMSSCVFILLFLREIPRYQHKA